MIQWTKFLTVILIITYIAAIAALAVPTIIRDINLGIDLRGGVYVLMEAQPPAGGGEDTTDQQPQGWWKRVTSWFDGLFGGETGEGQGGISDADIAGTIAVLQNRINVFGLAEPIIQREGDRRIRIELATDPNDPEQNQRAILETIGKTALLEFLNSQGETVLTGANLKNASVDYQPDDFGRSSPVVVLEFDAEGAQIFAELTRTHQGLRIPIHLDGEEISSPQVKTVITSGEAVISNIGSLDDAAELAKLLRSGALPLELVQLEVRTVGPLLGSDSLARSLRAGIIGLALVLLLMLAFYRMPGLMASFALLAYIVIVLGTMVALNAVLTLPGIAGIILTIGMAVDANVIIFERMKEELYNGKSPRASVLSGFGKAFSTIMDANITTLIVAAILFQFGTGPVRGFAVTLSIGVIVSMISALLITRVLMVNLVNSNVVKRNWMLGVNK